MRILSLDVGKKKVGIAISDALGITAQPLDTLIRKAKKAERAKEEKERIKAEKLAAVGDIENIINEIVQPLHDALNNQSHDIKALQDRNSLLESGLAALQKK